MARLIIVAGASGAGKTFMLSQLNSFRSDIQIVKKYTTRTSRKEEAENETLDLHLKCYDKAIRQCEYTYQYCGENYGIKKSEIDRALRQGKNPIVIVAKCSTISKIKGSYKNALVLFVHSGLSGPDLKEQLLKYRDPVNVEERMRRQDESYDDYIKHMNKGIFDHMLINKFDNRFIHQVEMVLEDELEAVDDSNYIFVIMSFDAIYDEAYKAMKYAAKLCGERKLRVERVDKHKGDYIITEKIEESIRKAELIICDLSERSPNVYYELGYARAIKKYVILTSHESNMGKLPFDIRQHKTASYKSYIELQRIIQDELCAYYNVK